MPLRTGVRLALDWGDARIGVAACDPGGVLAYPVATVVAGEHALATVVQLVAEYAPIEVLFGLPRTLAGTEGPAAVKLRSVALQLAGLLAGASRGVDGVPVRLVDERLSTVTASRSMRASGRNAPQQRSRIDQAAAMVILEHALDSERATGTAAGELLSPQAGAD